MRIVFLQWKQFIVRDKNDTLLVYLFLVDLFLVKYFELLILLKIDEMLYLLQK